MKTNIITMENFTRINNDVNGNPRYVIHYLDLIVYDTPPVNGSVDTYYTLAIKKAKTIGGKRYNTKSYGGGIVFQSYNLPYLVKSCNELLNINL